MTSPSWKTAALGDPHGAWRGAGGQARIDWGPRTQTVRRQEPSRERTLDVEGASPCAATETHGRALIALESIELLLDDLPELAEGWSRLPEGERAAWSLDWSNEMSRLQLVAQVTASGELPADDLARYRGLIRRLKTALPIIRQLNLYHPPVLPDE